MYVVCGDDTKKRIYGTPQDIALAVTFGCIRTGAIFNNCIVWETSDDPTDRRDVLDILDTFCTPREEYDRTEESMCCSIPDEYDADDVDLIRHNILSYISGKVTETEYESYKDILDRWYSDVKFYDSLTIVA